MVYMYDIAFVSQMLEVRSLGFDGCMCSVHWIFFCLLVDAVGGKSIFDLPGGWVSYCVCCDVLGVLILVTD